MDDLSWPKVEFLISKASELIEKLSSETNEEVLLEAFGALLSNSNSHPYSKPELIPDDEREKILRERVFLRRDLLPGKEKKVLFE